LARIYTRTGDDGTTGLIGGERVFKNSLRIEALGALDELNALIGVARALKLPERVDQILRMIQDHLFMLGTEIATPAAERRPETAVDLEAVQMLEEAIDFYEAKLTPLHKFILPGGGKAGAVLHLARAVARRAERQCVALSRSEEINMQLVSYLNRLSDLCFVIARFVNQHESVAESYPGSGSDSS